MDEVAEVRSFNRFYTAHVGALDDAYLGSPHGLTEARVLFELGRDEATEPGMVADNLGLDPSYLSRILARFERDGLVERRRAAHDARRRELRLTEDGRARGRELDERSSASVQQVLQAVPVAERARLLAAMRTVRTVLTEADLSSPSPAAATMAETAPKEMAPIADERSMNGVGTNQREIREPRPGDLGWVVQRNGALYAEEYGWDQTYEGLVARIIGDYGSEHDPDTERCWMATVGGERAGFVMCVRADDPDGLGRRTDVAKLRLLFVEPWARGHGVGSALVEQCVRFARTAGYARIGLWTNDPLTAARRIYDRAGFRLISEEHHTSFGRTMVGQVMELEL